MLAAVALWVASGSISARMGFRRRMDLTGVSTATSSPGENTQSEGKKGTEGNN